MNVEQRLVAALRTADQVEPSTDLWSRVVHSIEEDQAHRRRVVRSTALTISTAVLLFVVCLVGVTDGPFGRYVRLPIMEVVETVALVVLVAVLGPAIKRFGRGYATDLWRATPTTATALLKLLDVAYVLVFAGYILMSAQLDFTSPTELGRLCLSRHVDCDTVASQLQSAAQRIGGLMLVVGLLHAVTIAVLPGVALVSNSTRVGRPLPRWLMVVLMLGGIGAGLLLVSSVIGALIGLAAS